MEGTLDFEQLVNDVADGYERAQLMMVTSAGRRALVEPAVPYSGHVEHELSTGSISIGFLEASVFQVIETAGLLAKTVGRPFIDEPDIKESMKAYCPYLFWC